MPHQLPLPTRRLCCLLFIHFVVPCLCLAEEPRAVRIGSKSFTESVVLGELLSTLGRHAGATIDHRSELGGTQVLWQALQQGDIDAYVEYSGTLTEEILADPKLARLERIAEQLASQGIAMSKPLGFNNTYAIGMKQTQAEKRNITKISDLREHPELQIGFSDEFVDRKDGWRGLKAKYKLPHTKTRGLDHALAYRGVWGGSIDVIDLYATDPEIISYELRVLEDDLAYFPLYEAVILYRPELEVSHPAVVEQFLRLEGTMDNATMTSLNKSARIDHIPEDVVAAQFAHDHIDASIPVPDPNADWLQRRFSRFLTRSLEHLVLVGVSLTMAIACAIPLGIFAYRQPRLGEWILGTVGIIQTIPSMALLVFMIPLLGLGAKPAIVALFLYSLLPIVRGTHSGLANLPASIHESALALGLPSSARLRLIELPLAVPSILSGIKTSAVINIGTATIGAFIGAGGYGQPIITGIRLADLGLILQGAVPAAILALLVQAAFSWAERHLVTTPT
ncbi:Choline transport system permease protein OpuBB [Aureliella helgolandensis]|uniref:Choline transport system permease protein OpuBB n=2 Tax=Aureliella helgolandensis TaxID=2527968 RepID=A0A518GHC2_9BACT|nr:Choline transport system permease protein OpuBB [Aureliella helgolandensis]